VISPYGAARNEAMVGENFIMAYMDTPVGVAGERVKGPTSKPARPRSTAPDGFTGVDDPYEPPGSIRRSRSAMVRRPKKCA
jgi:adenylylsulfate kinase-like enzyme